MGNVVNLRPKVFIVGNNEPEYKTASSAFLRHGWAVCMDVANADMCVITGKMSIHPKTFGEKPLTNAPGIFNLEKDKAEWKFIQKWHKDKTLVGINRGALLLNVFMGGSIWQYGNNHDIAKPHWLWDFSYDEAPPVLSHHEQIMKPPTNSGVVKAVAYESKELVSERGCFKQKYLPEPEVIEFKEDRVLCFQPSIDDEETEKYFFHCLKRMWS